MNDRHISRRQFAMLGLLSGAGFLGQGAPLGGRDNGFFAPQGGAPTARQVVERIQKDLAEHGVTWRTQTVDTFKAGNPDTRVRGIATTFMATLDVLQRSVASGKNFIISHEPTFWNHLDNTQEFADDPVYRHKVDFIEKNDLVVWRFHDHLHARKPDMIFMRLAKKLGWEPYAGGENPRLFTMPETTLEALAKEAQSKLKSVSVRIVGDPLLKVTKVSNGSHSIDGNMTMLRNADVILVGEAREWDSVEYLRDITALNQKKGLILIAHQTWEEWGMEDCATWLRTLMPGTPIEWIPAGEPFWTLG